MTPIIKKSILLFLILFSTFATFSQTPLKTIKGKVYFSEGPLPNANIIIKGSKKGTQTNSKGLYSIKAQVGDILQYSYVGFKTVSIVIEDVTHTLNVALFPEINELDETIVVAKKTLGKEERIAIKKSAKFESGGRVIDPKKVGFSIRYIDKEDINTTYPDVSSLLKARYAFKGSKGTLFLKPPSSINNISPALWDVDGVLFDKEPPLSLDNITSIRIIKSLAGTNHYGTIGRGGVIIIKTIVNPNAIKEIKKKKLEKNYNTNLYHEDANQINTSKLYVNEHTKILEGFHNKKRAYQYFKENIDNKETDFTKLIDIAYIFNTTYQDKKIAVEILRKIEENNLTNPEILKAIAYQFQKLKALKEAINSYKKTFKLRPKYTQSYRDLANAFNENEQFIQSWRTYMTAFLKKMTTANTTIGNIMYTEMEWLYYNRKNQAKIKQKFVPRFKNRKDFENDVRILVEWNITDADFDLEFVNPQKQSYVFDHTSFNSESLIFEEKKLGYSMKDFMIDKITDGEWLMNLKYYGNKKEVPTYFKVTIYYNWGRPNQKQQTTVFKLSREQKDKKLQIVALNKSRFPS